MEMYAAPSTENTDPTKIATTRRVNEVLERYDEFDEDGLSWERYLSQKAASICAATAGKRFLQDPLGRAQPTLRAKQARKLKLIPMLRVERQCPALCGLAWEAISDAICSGFSTAFGSERPPTKNDFGLD